ncbi:MAG: hypothetical protein KatS3mg101_0932 [Patescibacteria group bacterium]|nr:MAG: hypothetical protein KatS3mg101_0932 [Patescibacteria group bacterium]
MTKTFNSVNEFFNGFLKELLTKETPFKDYDIIEVKLPSDREVSVNISDKTDKAKYIHRLLTLIGQEYYILALSDPDRNELLTILFLRNILFPVPYVEYYSNGAGISDAVALVDTLISYVLAKGVQNFEYRRDEAAIPETVTIDTLVDTIKNPAITNFYESGISAPLVTELYDASGVTERYKQAFENRTTNKLDFNLKNIFYLVFTDGSLLDDYERKLADEIKLADNLFPLQSTAEEAVDQYVLFLDKFDTNIISTYKAWLENNSGNNLPDSGFEQTVVSYYLEAKQLTKTSDDKIVQKILSLCRSEILDFIVRIKTLKYKLTFDEPNYSITDSREMIFEDTQRETVPSINDLESLFVERLEKSLDTETMTEVKKRLKESLKMIEDNIKQTVKIRIIIRYKDWEIVIEF